MVTFWWSCVVSATSINLTNSVPTRKQEDGYAMPQGAYAIELNIRSPYSG